MPRRAARKDATDNPESRKLINCGFIVIDLTQLGKGVPDRLVGGVDRNTGIFEWLLVEWKSNGGRLTPVEQAFRERLPPDAPYLVAYSADDVLEWYGAI